MTASVLIHRLAALTLFRRLARGAMCILKILPGRAAGVLISFFLLGLVVCEQLDAQAGAIGAYPGQRKTADGTALGETGAALLHPKPSWQKIEKNAATFVLQTEPESRSVDVKASETKRQTRMPRLLLTADISNVSLKRVLARLGQEIGAKIYLADAAPAELEEEISAAFERLPVKEGIKRILKDQNYIMIQENNPALGPDEKSKVSAESVVTKIYVLPKAAAGGMRQQPAAPEVPNTTSAEEQQEEVRAAAKRAVEATQDEEDRFAALDRLIIGADSSQVATTIEAALNDKDPDVRTYALGMIESADQVSIESLTEVALADASPDVRMHALETLLSAHGPAAAIPTLEQTLADPDPDVKTLSQQMLELTKIMQEEY
jgi:hypothetical protein